MPAANYLLGRVNMSSGRFVTPVPLQVVSTAALPEHVGASLVTVADGAGGDQVLAISDGQNWLRVDTLQPVSATGPGPTEPGGNVDVSGLTGAQLVFDRIRAVRHAQIQLNAAEISVSAANDFGGVQFVNLPDSNLIIAGVETDIVLTKGDTINGIRATTDLSVSVGTATAAANPPAGAAANILSVATLTTDAIEVDYNRHTNDETTPSLAFIDDGPSVGLFLNIGAVGGITADDTVTVNGTIDLYYIDTGNVTS